MTTNDQFAQQLDQETVDRAWLRRLDDDALDSALIARMRSAEEHGVDPLLHAPFIRAAEETQRREEARS